MTTNEKLLKINEVAKLLKELAESENTTPEVASVICIGYANLLIKKESEKEKEFNGVNYTGLQG